MFNLINKIEPKKASVQNSYYLEIPKSIMTSDKISLMIDVRDQSYEYVIK